MVKGLASAGFSAQARLVAHFRWFDVEHLSRFVRLDSVCYDLAAMEGENRERWLQLAEQAAGEKDPVILLKLVAEINELLHEKEQRLAKARLADKSANRPSASEAL
jgi:hypothetical protein